MEFFIVFLTFAAAVGAAWGREARFAAWLFGAAMICTVALYLHHATDALPLSF